MKLKVFLIAGARPNFMKIAPVFRQMQKYPEAFDPIIVHTGQHYDDNMSRVFFDDLELPRPDIYLDVGSASHATQTAEIMKRFEPQLLKHQPDVVLVVGDVNSTIACALTAVKVRIPSVNVGKLWQHYENHLQKRGSERKQASQHEWRIHCHEAPIIGHIEAGERSFDFRMPEEINRVTTDLLSDILFTTGNDGDKNLLAEGIDPRKIFCVGNIMIDSLQKCLAKAEQSKILEEMNQNHRPNHIEPIQGGQFALVTLHRPGNVDEPANLAMILSALIRISARLPIILPMHPRTRKLLSNLDRPFRERIAESHILITAPIGYLDFLHLQTRARMVLTDSGGVQVETSYLGVPCLTLRPNTEWQITLREGTNKLVPMNEEAIVEAANTTLGSKMSQPANIKYWDGGTASRIVLVFKDLFQL